MEKQRSEAIRAAKWFIENLPEEISYVITKDKIEETVTVGREYILSVLEASK